MLKVEPGKKTHDMMDDMRAIADLIEKAAGGDDKATKELLSSCRRVSYTGYILTFRVEDILYDTDDHLEENEQVAEVKP